MPQHGAQDQKTGDNPNYPMVFSQAHAKKKQHKPHSLGNEQELGKRQDVSPMVRKTLFPKLMKVHLHMQIHNTLEKTFL